MFRTVGNASDGHQVNVVYNNGGQRNYKVWGGNANLTQSTNALGQVIAYRYGGDRNAGFLTGKTVDGVAHDYVRDTRGRLLSSTSASNKSESVRLDYERDQAGKVVAISMVGGAQPAVRTQATRDTRGRVVTTQQPDGGTQTYTYDDLNRIVAYSDSNGRSFTQTYEGNVIRQFNTTTQSTKEVRYHTAAATPTPTTSPAGMIAETVDELGRVTNYDYDAEGRLTRTTLPDGNTVQFAYDARGNLIRRTDEAGKVWTWAYGTHREVLTAIDPLGRTTTYDYTLPANCGCAATSSGSSPRPTRIINPAGEVTEFHYDLEGRLISHIAAADSPAEAISLRTYDARGNVLTEQDPLGRITTHTYDALNRRLSSKDPLGRITRWTYDFQGNVLTETSPDNRVTSHVYDPMGRRTQTTDALGQITRFAYDTAGNLTQLTDPRGSITRWSYDTEGRLLRKTYADGTYEERTYDKADNLTLFRTPAGVTRASTFDVRNRELTTDWSDATPDLTRAYDSAGRLVSLTTAGVSTHAYAYDDAGQLLSETTNLPAVAPLTTPASFTVSYAYDLAGRRQSLTYPDGTQVGYVYTARGQLAGIATDGPPPLATFTYDAAGRRTQKTLENGVVTTYAYDNADQLTALVHRDPQNRELLRLGYSYDLGGRRTAKTSSGLDQTVRSETYAYDAIDQLKTFGLSGGLASEPAAETYAYDAMGNRTRHTRSVGGTLADTRYTSNALNQYTALSFDAGLTSTAPTYDQNGNTLTLPGGRSFAYDGQSRLTLATVLRTDPATQATEVHQAAFNYDGRNRQVRRTVDGVTTYFVWDGWSLLAEYGVENGQLIPAAAYVHGPRLDEILVQIRPTTPSPLYLHEDALGSTVLSTDSNAAVSQRYHYGAYGEVTAADASGTPATSLQTRFLYTGREWIGEVGLDDHRHRFYMPNVGRRLSRDPIQERGGLNLYGYVGNDPISKIDALGLMYEDDPAWGAYQECLNGCLNVPVCGGQRRQCREDCMRRYAEAKESPRTKPWDESTSEWLAENRGAVIGTVAVVAGVAVIAATGGTAGLILVAAGAGATL